MQQMRDDSQQSSGTTMSWWLAYILMIEVVEVLPACHRYLSRAWGCECLLTASSASSAITAYHNALPLRPANAQIIHVMRCRDADMISHIKGVRRWAYSPSHIWYCLSDCRLLLWAPQALSHFARWFWAVSCFPRITWIMDMSAHW